jgi:transcriptional regulator with XRE-family HTH domain
MADISAASGIGSTAAIPAAGPDGGGLAGGGLPADSLAGDIGRRLAAHRAARGLRVAELAREVGVTPSLISQIEHGQSRPSVSTLFALAQALAVPVDAFFRENPPAAAPAPGPGTPAAPDIRPAGPDGRYLVRRASRAAIDIEGGVRWERLTRATYAHLDFFELIYQPGAESHPRPYTHPGTEMVLVTAGTFDITIGFDPCRLEPGDSIDFPSTMPHRYHNPGQHTARAVTVILYDCPGDGTNPHLSH